MVFLDLPKAFDSVPHERLLLKLKSNGIDGCLHAWLRHFQTGRRQRVILRGTRSNWSSFTSGTPQGTILGPFTFLTDDTKIYRQIVDPIKDPQLLQMDLSNLMEWARKWQLRFNANKCESMIITNTRNKSITQYMLDKPLKDAKSFKDLGITISKDLSWDNHISITVNKANNLLGLIKHLEPTLVNVFSTLYLSLVRPIRCTRLVPLPRQGHSRLGEYTKKGI